MNSRSEQTPDDQTYLSANVPRRSDLEMKSRSSGSRKTEFRLSEEEYALFSDAARQRHGDKKGAKLELFLDMLELLKIAQP